MTALAPPAAGARRATGWSVAALAVTLAGMLAGAALLVCVPAAPGDFRSGVIFALCYLCPYGLAGAFLIRRRPDLPFGWLLAGTAALLSLSVFASGLGTLALLRRGPANWPVLLIEANGLQFTAVAVQGLINVRFPSGRVESRLGRWLNAAMIAGVGLLIVGGLLGTSVADHVAQDLHQPVHNPLTGAGAFAHAMNDTQAGGPVVVLLGLVAGVHIVIRAWRARGLARHQLLWRAAGVLVGLGLFPLGAMDLLPTVADLLDGSVFVATLVVPILRHHLWEIDTVMRRSVAYALVTVLLGGAYLAIAAAGAAIATQRAGIVVAAFVVAVAFGPALTASQRAVDRVFYGRRRDPYRAMSELNRRLAAVAEPGTVLPTVVAGVATLLRLPYVAIERDGQVLAAHGRDPVATTRHWALAYQGVPAGRLVASPRAGETTFGARDRAVLGDLADQLGAAVHAEALTTDLIESRQRLVNAREDERRRLRRELHDSLGPMLTALGLNVDAARARLAALPEAAAADASLARAREVSARAMADLRGIVYGLRPPALDDLGLAGAVRTNAARFTDGTGLVVTVEPDDVGELPAAVEVAAFRIAVEAVSNVARHARARACSVRFTLRPGPAPALSSALSVEVCDDGGSGTAWRLGVGLLGMRERVAELGGELAVGPTPQGGRVHALLPLSPP